MWFYMAGMEASLKEIQQDHCKFGLLSFYSLTQKNWPIILEHIDHILVDSGAYTFQRGKSVDFDEFVDRYYNFIRENTNNPKITGFFEMDIDNIVGYEKVLEYRRKLESVSDKIIPVWHGNRGIPDYIEMCKKYSGRRIAITALGEDIDTGQYNLFINTAHKYGCKIHILGMTDKRMMEVLNLGKEDSFDSVGWKMAGAFASIALWLNDNNHFMLAESMGRIAGVTSPNYNIINYHCFRRVQDYYVDIDRSLEIN